MACIFRGDACKKRGFCALLLTKSFTQCNVYFFIIYAELIRLLAIICFANRSHKLRLLSVEINYIYDDVL